MPNTNLKVHHHELSECRKLEHEQENQTKKTRDAAGKDGSVRRHLQQQSCKTSQQLGCRVEVVHRIITEMSMAEAKSHLARGKYEAKLVVVEAREYQETRKAMIHSMPSSAFKQHKREGKTNAMGKTKSRTSGGLVQTMSSTSTHI